MSAAYFSVDRIRELVAQGAKVEPFNGRYAKMSLRRPAPELGAIADPLNRFFAEGAPEYHAPFLILRDFAIEADAT